MLRKEKKTLMDVRYQNLDEQKLLKRGWNTRQPDFTSTSGVLPHQIDTVHTWCEGIMRLSTW